MLRHAARQRDYLAWKVQEVARILDSPYWIQPYEAKCRGKAYPAYRWYSQASEELKRLRTVLYQDGVKTITPEFLSCIDRRGLAVFHMDDGSLYLRKRGRAKDGTPYVRERTVELALYLPYREVCLVRDWIGDLTGADLTPREPMRKLSPGKYTLRGSGKQARAFVQALQEFQFPSMSYKFDLQYDTHSNRGKSHWSEADLRQHAEADKRTRARDT